MFDATSKHRKRDKIFRKRKEVSNQKLSIGIIFGVCLTLITIVLQCVAFSTPHWKEITSNTHSLYVDGVDALIRTEILHYFNSVHRYSRLSYGLFQRCEYRSSNSSLYNNQVDSSDLDTYKSLKKCTKNFLPRYKDDHFNECHSLSYYQFCTKASEKSFNINDHYLHATFDISHSPINGDAKVSCDCHYPLYLLICQIIGILAIIFLCVTCLLFSLFSCFTNLHYRLKIKYFGMLSSLLAIIFLMINLILVFEHFEYESIAYLVAIEKHYKSNQIYKLSDDAKTALHRFLSSINIRMGYSAIIAWIAFVLSIIDGLLLLATCEIKHDYSENEIHSSLISPETDLHHNPLQFTSVSNNSQSSPPPMHVINNHEENSLLTSSLYENNHQPLRTLKEDEV
ncbi:unnamed protein product [Rotaria socialis]|uniref:Uncharacterized protein n=1 Tax=Rotaria socialis TaxID=392032 RepID=A0A818T3I6_9BILA|nr:unnamed protein product [Rotaria socialis]CAF3424159.1 unnamed protein product [Rotaria socialis]CAF3674418.1 unnamed protein product [Rotaria socialis]CAF3691372.1 unnamed protein product [Rotaria socialis]CAF4173334.1 unnamed protein product [Rotaria socialis]